MKLVLSPTSRFRIPDNVISHNLQGEEVILNLTTGVYWGLDQVGTQIWRLLQKHSRLSDLQKAMLNEYDVQQERLQNDLAALLERLVDQGLVEVVNEGMD